MIRFLVAGNLIACPHPPGTGSILSTQGLVFIEGHPIAVKPNPVGTPIAGCPNVAIPNVPCALTLTAEDRSFSRLVFVGGDAVCLDTAGGLTNGSPPGTAKYRVVRAGQDLVETDS
jgi:hypothetical protein